MTVAKYPPAGGVVGVAAGLEEGHKMLLRIEMLCCVWIPVKI